VETIKRQTWDACGCLATRFKVLCARGLVYGLQAARPLCLDTKCHCSCSFWSVALCK